MSPAEAKALMADIRPLCMEAKASMLKITIDQEPDAANVEPIKSWLKRNAELMTKVKSWGEA